MVSREELKTPSLFFTCPFERITVDNPNWKVSLQILPAIPSARKLSVTLMPPDMPFLSFALVVLSPQGQIQMLF